jgi:hypothetical protein
LIEIKEVSGICRGRASGRKIIRDRPFFSGILWKATGMYIGATELVLINSIIVLLIVIDGIIRIGSTR